MAAHAAWFHMAAHAVWFHMAAHAAWFHMAAHAAWIHMAAHAAWIHMATHAAWFHMAAHAVLVPHGCTCSIAGSLAKKLFSLLIKKMDDTCHVLKINPLLRMSYFIAILYKFWKCLSQSVLQAL